MQTEEFIWDLLKKEYGSLREEVSPQLKKNRVKSSVQGIEVAKKNFIKNCSATNWNVLVSAMVSYQYWQQKATTEEE